MIMEIPAISWELAILRRLSGKKQQKLDVPESRGAVRKIHSGLTSGSVNILHLEIIGVFFPKTYYRVFWRNEMFCIPSAFILGLKFSPLH